MDFAVTAQTLYLISILNNAMMETLSLEMDVIQYATLKKVGLVPLKYRMLPQLVLRYVEIQSKAHQMVSSAMMETMQLEMDVQIVRSMMAMFVTTHLQMQLKEL